MSSNHATMLACQRRNQFPPQQHCTIVRPSWNACATPITGMGCRQCLPFSWTTLRGKHCQYPIALVWFAHAFRPRPASEDCVNLYFFANLQKLSKYSFCGSKSIKNRNNTVTNFYPSLKKVHLHFINFFPKIKPVNIQ